MKWITDLTNKEIGEEIERLCKLGDLQPPELPKETAGFIRDEFGRYDSSIIRLAFDRWVSGHIKITAYAKANANFICKVLREYITENRHKLTLKPRKYLDTPSVNVAVLTPEEIKEGDMRTIRLCKEQWVKYVLSEESGFISYIILIQVYNLLEKYNLMPKDIDEDEIDKYIELYKKYRTKSDIESLRSATNEVKRSSIQKIIQRASEHHVEWYKVGVVGYYFTNTK